MRWKNQRITGTRHKPQNPSHPRRRGLHIVRNDVPKEHHCSRIPSLLLSAKNLARLTCSVVNALAAVRSRYQFFAGMGGPPSPQGEGLNGPCHPPRPPCVRSDSSVKGNVRAADKKVPPAEQAGLAQAKTEGLSIKSACFANQVV